jgi:RNA polymerase II elongation factor ELL
LNLSSRSFIFSEFTRILSVEQRRKYKTEFDQDYQEYRELHTMMEGVSQKFTMLEDRLRQVTNNERQYRVSFSI